LARTGDELAYRKQCHKLLSRYAEALFVRSMALTRTGNQAAAKSAFDRASAILTDAQAIARTRPVVDAAWHDFAICELLQAESEQLAQHATARTAEW
jgi:hypothetical protein